MDHMLLLEEPLEEAVSGLEEKVHSILHKMGDDFCNDDLIAGAFVVLPFIHHRLV